jgi:hypothetical protein
MTQAERGSEHLRRAAEHEAAGRREESDAEGAKAQADVTEAKQGRPPLDRSLGIKTVDAKRGKSHQTKRRSADGSAL